MHKNRRRGVSSVIAAVILLPVILGILAYAIYNLQTQYVTYSNMLSNQAYRALSNAESLDGTIIISGNTLELSIRNNGLSNSYLEYVMVRATLSTGATTRFLLNLTTSQFTPVAPITGINTTGTIQPGKGILIQPGSKEWIYITFEDTVTDATAGGLTFYGKYVSFHPPVKAMASAIASTFVMFTVPSLTDLGSRSDIEVLDSNETLAPASPSDPGSGMVEVGDSGLWCLVQEIDNASILGTLHYTVNAIGFSSGWTLVREGPAQYSMLVTSDKHTVADEDSLEIWNSTTQHVRINDLLSDYKGVRIIMYRYTGKIDLADDNGVTSNTNNPANVIGIRFYGYVNDSVIDLNGTAWKVYIYARSEPSECGGSTTTSYTPYLILGDFDNNGYTELLFITEDGFFSTWGGSETIVNEQGVVYYTSYRSPGDDKDIFGYYSYYDFDDQSQIPLTFVFKGYPIDSNKYAAVQVSIRYYFHDNAGGDEDELTDNRWILKVGLYDPVNKTLASYYQLRYQYLSRIEDTYPPSWDFRIDTIQLLIPQTGKTYYLALQFQDPYGEEPDSPYNDGDIMVGVEYLSMVFMERG